MPLDTKRLPVPEGTISSHLFLNKKKKVLGQRKDRDTKESRPIFLRVGVNTNAKGSAYLEMGKTKIISSVFGPREVVKRQEFSIKGQLFCQLKFAPFSCHQRRQHQPDAQEKELGAILKESLEPAICLNKFPKSCIDVFVMILENDGCALGGAITCASAAVADAGIDMYDIAVGCSLRQQGRFMLIDPTADEEFDPKSEEEAGTEDNGNLTLGYMPSFQQVAALHQDGAMKPETISMAMKVLVEQSISLSATVQKVLLQSLKNQPMLKSEHGNKELPPAS